jgi:glycosyltransferase involved in cell wall biosynthesis
MLNYLNKTYPILANRKNSSVAANVLLRYLRVFGVLSYNLFRNPSTYLPLVRRVQLSALPKEPLVSIVVPTFNQELFLNECLSSILNQTYRNIETIVVDDGSNIETKSILKQFENNHQLRIISHRENRGLPSALNSGLNQTNGELISWVSSDNFLEKSFVEEFVKELKKSPKYGVVYSNFKVVDQFSKKIGKDIGWRNYDRVSREPSNLVMLKFCDIRKIDPINVVGPSFMMRREVFQFVGGYFAPQGVEDYHFWRQAGQAFKFKKIYHNRVLYFYRIHRNSLTSKANSRNYLALLKSWRFEENEK